MKKQKTNKWIQLSLLFISGCLTLLYIVCYGIIDGYVSAGSMEPALERLYTGSAAVAGLVLVCFLILAAYFIKGGRKAVPIICAIICSLVIAMAYFAYSFSSYGS